jgi:hypothetical protein
MATMTLSKWTAAGIAFGILLVGFGFGRFATPTKMLERDHIVTSERDTELTWHAYVGHTETKIETKTAWQTVTKWEKDGTVTQTVAAVQDHKEGTRTDVTEADGKVKEVVTYKDIEHVKLVESKPIDWVFTGQAGAQFDGWKPIYGIAGQRRIAGPLFAGVWLQSSALTLTNAAGGISVGLVF